MEGLSVVGVRLEIASFLGSADALRFLRLRSDAKRGVEGDDGHLRLHTFDFLSARQGIALLRRVACPAVRVFRVDGGAIGRGDGTEEVLKFRLMRRFPRCRNIEVFGLAVRSPLVRVTIGAGDYELDLHPRGTPLTRVAGYCAAYATGPDPFFRVLPSLVLDLSRSITSVETRERRGGSL